MNGLEILGEQLISEFLTKIQKDMVAYMQSENRNATGKSAASIQLSNVTGTGGQLIGNGAIEYVFRGRGPGKMPPISALIDWCNARGLPRGVAWAVAKIIAAAGTKLWQQGRNVLDEIITEEKINAFKDSILKTFTAQIKSQINLAIAA